ncbi:MmgE/PrpD family protein [Chromobacterium violaceum]|uniref:MmgE/PrpD family protein n=1 Tax=Chromobacterium violaceum TaxID=536 RepID=UPI0002F5693B|nr:MmgE/PrpD family protein [Chromobacterium violaceum]SUX83733.1 2-methylcitrate dehydratase [Chromobacterium violaceum]
MSLEASIARYAATIQFEQLTPGAVEIALQAITDILGVTIAGAEDPDVAILAGVVESWGGAPQATVLGRRARLPAPMAALLNGAASRVLDFDDVADPLGTHPSVALFPALLAIAEQTPGVSGREFITAFAIGQDLSVRLAEARRETLLQSGRYDLSKVIAATAAAGRLHRLSEEQLRHAMGIAYTSALGEAQCMIDGAPTVSYQQGLVASNAVKAVLLAKAGFGGTVNFLTGRWGYYSSFEPGSDLSRVSGGLGERFAGEGGVAFKPYPTCRPNTSAAAVTLALTGGRPYRAEEIETISIRTNRQIYDLVSAPVEQKREPQTIVDARFSIAYNVAVALATGDVFIDDFTEEAIRRPDVIAISRLVHPETAAECEIPELGTHGLIKVEIRLRDGSVLQGQIDYPKGNPRNPMSRDEIQAKFVKCVSRSGQTALAGRAQAILRAIDGLPEQDSPFSSVLGLLCD